MAQVPRIDYHKPNDCRVFRDPDFMNRISVIRGGLALLLSCAGVLPPGGKAYAHSTNRGVWCWKTSGSPFGLDSIIGANAPENASMGQFKLWGVSRVYGSYGDQLASASGKTALAQWNSLLSSNGIQSQLLISDDTFGSGDNNLLIEMMNFNKSWPSAAQCQGVHLDIEPWGLSTWNNGTNYQMLANLAGVYQQVRAELNSNQETNVLIYADLADWLDNPASVNWPSTAVRDQWYADILTNLAGFTLMAYEQPSFPRISNVVSWEITNYPGVVRVGIDAGAGETWSNLAAFGNVADQVESTYGDSAGVDIYDFITVEEKTPAALAPGSEPSLAATGFNLTLEGQIGSNYVIEGSTDLFNWRQITNLTSKSWVTSFDDLSATNYSHQFYRIMP